LECQSRDLVEVWQGRIRNLRKKIKGWSRNREAVLKKPKNKLVGELDQLDKLAESRPLSAQERERRRELIIKLDETWKIEEISARQRSREREIKEGDHNIPFFAKASQRKRKKSFLVLKTMESL
jgi:hypothetical protein